MSVEKNIVQGFGILSQEKTIKDTPISVSANLGILSSLKPQDKETLEKMKKSAQEDMGLADPTVPNVGQENIDQQNLSAEEKKQADIKGASIDLYLEQIGSSPTDSLARNDAEMLYEMSISNMPTVLAETQEYFDNMVTNLNQMALPSNDARLTAIADEARNIIAQNQEILSVMTNSISTAESGL